MKNMIRFLIVPFTLFFVLFALVQDVSAQSPVHADGKIMEDRMLLPVRAVAEGLGADVRWNQMEQEVTITRGSDTIVLKVDSLRVKVNEWEATLDVPTLLERGTTYVPLRFVSNVFRATIEWDQQEKRATITLDGETVIVTAQSIKQRNPSKLSEARMNAFVQKANEAADVSKIFQIRTHFQPYFTDELINTLIRQNGLEHRHQFRERPSIGYIDTTDGYIIQTNEFETTLDPFLQRHLTIKQVDGVWKVVEISFGEYERRY